MQPHHNTSTGQAKFLPSPQLPTSRPRLPSPRNHGRIELLKQYAQVYCHVSVLCRMRLLHGVYFDISCIADGMYCIVYLCKHVNKPCCRQRFEWLLACGQCQCLLRVLILAHAL